jgi:hypothetical protein
MSLSTSGVPNTMLRLAGRALETSAHDQVIEKLVRDPAAPHLAL